MLTSQNSAETADSHEQMLARTAVEDGARAYFEALRGRVKPFLDKNFSIIGTLRLHRPAFGWDILRAPINLSLALPQIIMQLFGKLVTKRAPRFAIVLRRPIVLQTAVSRELEWLMYSELLQLPFQGRNCETIRDALTDAILSSEEVAGRVRAAMQAKGDNSDPLNFHARLALAMREYGLTRMAAAEITTGLMSLGGGALTLHKLTPGAVSLGPALAGILAQQAAIGAFPLGGLLGGIWYSFFPALPAAGLVATTTSGLMLAATLLAAFSGIISDPIQRAVGLHERRLRRMVASLERQFFDPASAGFAVHDHYVARLLDFFDMLGAAARLSH